MVIIGLTGSVATGKTTVAGMFRELGARVLDADRIAHQLLQPGRSCYCKIVRHFGAGILSRTAIDRQRLAEIAFCDPKERKFLESMVHPQVLALIRKQIRTWRQNPRIAAVVLDVPLLFEANWQKVVDVTVTVISKRSIQLTRFNRKTGMSRTHALKRIRAQLSQREKAARSDYVINNNGTIKETAQQVLHIWKKILKSHRGASRLKHGRSPR